MKGKHKTIFAVLGFIIFFAIVLSAPVPGFAEMKKEYYENGKIHYISTYSKGELIDKKEYY
jgi:hypothetical protein